MKIKKTNAALSLLTVLLLLLHIGYTVYCYLTFSHNAFLSKLFSIPFIAATCLHAVLGMCSVFLLGDGTSLALYPRQNRRTVIQRVSAALIFPLLLLHVRTFQSLQASAQNEKWFVFALLIAVQIVFYGVIISHTAASVTRALITLGWLCSEKTQKTLDRIILILGVLIFLIAAVSVVRTQIIMFVH